MLMLIMLSLYIGLFVCTILYLKKLGKKRNTLKTKRKQIAINERRKNNSNGNTRK